MVLMLAKTIANGFGGDGGDAAFAATMAAGSAHAKSAAAAAAVAANETVRAVTLAEANKQSTIAAKISQLYFSGRLFRVGARLHHVRLGRGVSCCPLIVHTYTAT